MCGSDIHASGGGEVGRRGIKEMESE